MVCNQSIMIIKFLNFWVIGTWYHKAESIISARDKPHDRPTSSRHIISAAFSLIDVKLNVSATSSSCTIVADACDEILHLVAIVGGLCTFFLSEQFHRSKEEQQCKECAGQVENEQRTSTTAMLTETPRLENENHYLKRFSEKKKAGCCQLGRVFLQLFVVARVCGIDLRTSILKKIELNGRKYPVEPCKVKSLDFCQWSRERSLYLYGWYSFPL